MFKQIFRITFLTFIWKQYKRLIVSTLLLFAFLWVVGSVHEDYLNYARLQEDQALVGLSFIYKWSALAGGILIYLLFNLLLRKRAPTTQSQESDQPQASGWFARRKAARAAAKSEPYPQAYSQADPFAEIRNKKKLRTRAEMMIDHQQKKRD